MNVTAQPAEMLQIAVAAASAGGGRLCEILDALPAPIYVTDADGWVTFFNRACVDFAGRTPVPGQDRWCVTWRLYTEAGEELPHDQCPMAVAVRERRAIRGVVAIAERPDGSRVVFTPYPTPIHDENGCFAGAVNMLVDLSDARQAASFDAQAHRCRRLAKGVTDQRTVDSLLTLASEYERKARTLGAT